jgi:Pyridoxamine 5'-phosphate oxidase
MATWNAFAESAPELAELGLKLLNQFGAAFLATVRKDGSPRLHPVVPIVTQRRLFVFCGGPKVYDLRRDGRYSLHALRDSLERDRARHKRCAPRHESPHQFVVKLGKRVPASELPDASFW